MYLLFLIATWLSQDWTSVEATATGYVEPHGRSGHPVWLEFQVLAHQCAKIDHIIQYQSFCGNMFFSKLKCTTTSKHHQ